jgi:uncharacterized protein YybS (DUF2232 family)
MNYFQFEGLWFPYFKPFRIRFVSFKNALNVTLEDSFLAYYIFLKLLKLLDIFP